MRLTLRLLKGTYKHNMKRMWQERGKYVYEEVPVPEALKNIEIIDAIDLFKKKKPTLEEIDPELKNLQTLGYQSEPTPEEHRNYHDQVAYQVSIRNRFSEGMKQACILTKCQHIEGMPEQVKKLIGQVSIPDQDLLVQREIMRSQLWYNRHVKLIQRVDPENIRYHFKREMGIKPGKQDKLLMTGILTLAQRIAAQKSTSSLNRRLIPEPSLETSYDYKGKKIVLNVTNHSLLTGRTQLSPFASSSLVEETKAYSLPSMFPIYPTIDFNQTNIYTDNKLAGFQEKPEYYSEYVPQTVYSTVDNVMAPEQKQAYSLMICLGYAATVARMKYGPDVKDLPEPVIIQNVNIRGTTFNFLFLQLNTLDISRDDGVKNIVWTDSGNSLFEIRLPKPWLGPEEEFNTKLYHSYNPEVFRKILAVHLNGLADTRVSNEEQARIEQGDTSERPE